MVQHLVQSQCLHEDIRLFSFVLAMTPVPSDHSIESFSRVLLDSLFYQMNYGIRCKRRFEAHNGRVFKQVGASSERLFTCPTYMACRWLHVTV